MNTRKDFLAVLFRLLETKAVACCVLRNYEELLTEEAASDVDLLLEKKDLARFNECLQAAATETGQRFVHYAHYVNHSCVFWNARSGFIRIDFDTEIRWRIFPVLSARTMLASRQKHAGFDVPHPRHEAAALFVQALWMGKLPERYRGKLAWLYEACTDKKELRQTYREAFGGAGVELTEFHSQVAKLDFTSAFRSRLKWSIVRKTFLRPTQWKDFAAHAMDDARRLWERLRQPAGISLLYMSSAGHDKKLDEFMRRIEFLFPAQKCSLHTMDLTAADASPKPRGLGLELQRLRALFKGGLFVQFYRLAHDADLARVLKAQSRNLYPSRCFICTEDSHGRACLAHVGTGHRSGSDEGEAPGKMDFSALLISFIATVLEGERNRGT